jgi:hypothetical protein
MKHLYHTLFFVACQKAVNGMGTVLLRKLFWMIPVDVCQLPEFLRSEARPLDQCLEFGPAHVNADLFWWNIGQGVVQHFAILLHLAAKLIQAGMRKKV